MARRVGPHPGGTLTRAPPLRYGARHNYNEIKPLRAPHKKLLDKKRGHPEQVWG